MDLYPIIQMIIWIVSNELTTHRGIIIEIRIISFRFQWIVVSCCIAGNIGFVDRCITRLLLARVTFIFMYKWYRCKVPI
jgi:hypothetical protein